MKTNDGISDNRACPVCGSKEHRPFADEQIDHDKISDFSYSSRKQPEFMRLQLVECLKCSLIYSLNPPDESFLANAYADASFDSGDEAVCAAKSYANALAPYVVPLKNKNAAIDVGAGSGPLLPWLVEVGFKNVIGIEPSKAAINAAPMSVRFMLKEGMFDHQLLEGVNPSLICSFMTLEHMRNPREFVKSAFDLLEPGGMIAVVVHNWQGVLNRILGLRSPIIDIEHLQLFNPSSVTSLLEIVGFENIKVQPILNSYPIKYWLRLTPLPVSIKSVIETILKKVSLSEIKIPMRVGNLLAVGLKK